MVKPSKIVDALLVISYQAGDKESCELLVRRWNKKLCLHAYGYVRDWALAKDITQDTWSTILTKIHMLRDSNSFGSWAMTITTRKSLDAVARRKKWQHRTVESLPISADDENRGDSKEQRIARLQRAMQNLPFDQRMVLKLFYLESYSIKEISRITKVSTSTVKTRLFRAREKLKEVLKNE